MWFKKNKTTMSKFSERLKSFWRELLAFVTSPVFIKNFLLMLAVFGLFMLALFLWMKYYTRHGESLQVENYVDMHIDDAIKQARGRSFEIVILDSIYVPGRKDANMVLQQNPKAFSRVKKNRTIYMTVTRGEGDPVCLPRLTGRDEYSQYARALQALDIKLEVRERIYSTKFAENTILRLLVDEEEKDSKDLNNCVKVLPGSTVQAVVTERGNSDITVPNLKCMLYEDALFALRSADLNVGTERPDPSVSYKQDAYVYRQIPAAGKTIRVGEQVDIFLQQARPTGCPDYENQEADNTGF